MKPNFILLGAIVAAFGSASLTGALAAGEKKDQEAAGVGTPQAVKQPFEKLDTDNDGNIGHSEAMADEDAGSKFHELDTNDDLVLSREEYAAWEADEEERPDEQARGDDAQKEEG